MGCTVARELAASRPSELEQWFRTVGVGCTLTKALLRPQRRRVSEIVVVVVLQSQLGLRVQARHPKS
jgi:hypothetical protein